MTHETASAALVAISRKILKQRLGNFPMSIEAINQATYDASTLFACTDDDIRAARQVLVAAYMGGQPPRRERQIMDEAEIQVDCEIAHERHQLGGW